MMTSSMVCGYDKVVHQGCKLWWKRVRWAKGRGSQRCAAQNSTPAPGPEDRGPELHVIISAERTTRPPGEGSIRG